MIDWGIWKYSADKLPSMMWKTHLLSKTLAWCTEKIGITRIVLVEYIISRKSFFSNPLQIFLNAGCRLWGELLFSHACRERRQGSPWHNSSQRGGRWNRPVRNSQFETYSSVTVYCKWNSAFWHIFDDIISVRFYDIRVLIRKIEAVEIV